MKPEKLLPKRLSRALDEYQMINEGDRIILALSGGKDSLAMARFLSRMAPRWIRPFTVEAVHVRAPWEGKALPEWIKQTCADWNLPYREIPLSDTTLSPEGMNCSACSRHRRRALLTLADREGFHSIALGHHMEDSLETFLMNMIYHSRLDPLLPCRLYPLSGEAEKKPRSIKLIRPLILVQEEIILRWQRDNKLTPPETGCPWESPDSRRKEMRRELEGLTGGSANKKLNMFKAALEGKTSEQERETRRHE
ncbi:MAG: tRNA 2-thiocytidine biosynthesis TtcA family protein [Spirochaetales bacterium]|nr:tRNA 2-thiocytidine biosynthesis TtcA family protein [Spirochaetales bacterium]